MPPSDQGHEVEDYARRLAGDLGVPDFVYEPVLERRGRGVREISDGLLVVGQDGLIIQVKSREQPAGADDSPQKAATWCQKKGLQAQRQAGGTRRILISREVRVQSLRGIERRLPDATDWPSVVILDHPDTPAVSFPPSSDTVFVSLNDWRNLHWMVRSTAGVIAYVRRALASGISVPLGREADRYKQLAAADLQACQTLASFPTLSPVPLDECEEGYAALVDDLVDKVADPQATGWHPEQYLQIVEQLDRIPLIGRARLGAKMARTMLAMHEAEDRRSFICLDRELTNIHSSNRLAFFYDYYDHYIHGIGGERFTADVACYGFLRQQHALDAGADPASATLVVGMLHHPLLGNKYQFAWVPGVPPQMPADIRSYLEQEYGVFDGAAVRPVAGK